MAKLIAVPVSGEEKKIINIDPSLCTGCQNCLKVCQVKAINGERGQPQSIDYEVCLNCGQCVQVCSSFITDYRYPDDRTREQKFEERGLGSKAKDPLFAAYNRGDVPKIEQLMAKPGLFRVVQCAPAVRVALAEDFRLPLGALTPGKLARALRILGFDRVYDSNFSADLTIMEEGSELLDRIQNGGVLPMFTSCCPAWVRYVELNWPDLVPHLSSCKSPQQMLGAVIKTYGASIDQVAPENILSVSVMPCTAKKYEAERVEMNSSGYRDIDTVLTTRELAAWIKARGLDFASLPEDSFDEPLGNYTGAGTLFGVTGGVMEAALRTAYALITGEELSDPELPAVRGGEGLRSAFIPIGDLTVKVAVVSGLKHAQNILAEVRAGLSRYHFIEVMSCPLGCISGGGQPKVLLPQMRPLAYEARTKSTYQHDRELAVRKSHQNPQVTALYDNFLEKPLGHRSHEFLHTTYRTGKSG